MDLGKIRTYTLLDYWVGGIRSGGGGRVKNFSDFGVLCFIFQVTGGQRMLKMSFLKKLIDLTKPAQIYDSEMKNNRLDFRSKTSISFSRSQ